MLRYVAKVQRTVDKEVLEDNLKCVRGRRGMSAQLGFRSRSAGLRAEVSG